jgi:hypothetical protein
MTGRAKFLVFVALIGIVLGSSRGRLPVMALCITILLWIVWEGFLFLTLTYFELRSLRIKRTVRGRSQAKGVLWSDREVDIETTVTCEPGGFRADRIIRDLVPENLELKGLRLEHFGTPTVRGKSSFFQHTKIGRALTRLVLGERPVFAPNEIAIRAPVKSATIPYRVRVLGAGEVVIPGIRITMQDRWKLFRLDRQIEAKQVFRVLPSYVALKEISSITKRVNAIPRQGIHRQARPGLGFEILELREYMEGDPPKAIAWKASARREQLMTRQFESEVPVRVQLILDGTVGTRLGGFGLRLLDQISSTASSIAHAVINSGDSVGSYLIDEQGVKRVKSAGGESGFLSQLKAYSDFSIDRSPRETRLTVALVDACYAVCGERYPELLHAGVNSGVHGWFSAWMPMTRRKRSQLSGVFAILHRASVMDQLSMANDDELFVRHLLRFMRDAGLPWMPPLASPSDVAWYQSTDRIPFLSQALSRATTHAKDTEVFVVIAELFRSPRHLDELLSAIKFAKARHHRVLVICPSPTFRRPVPYAPTGTIPESAAQIRLAAEHLRMEEIAIPARRTLTKLGVPLSICGEPKAIGIVMTEVGMARQGRASRTGHSR